MVLHSNPQHATTFRTSNACQDSDSVKRHLRGRHLSVLNLKFDFISDGGCTREEQIALSLKRHLFPHGGREPKAFWICFSRVHPPSEIKSNFKFKTLKRHLLKRHLTLSERSSGNRKRCRQTGSRQSTPYRRYGPDTEIQYRLRKPHGPAKRSRIPSKREADTEFQYRPYIVDTDAITDARFADAISETSRSGKTELSTTTAAPKFWPIPRRLW